MQNIDIRLSDAKHRHKTVGVNKYYITHRHWLNEFMMQRTPPHRLQRTLLIADSNLWLEKIIRRYLDAH
jgi:hypothetical protein